MAILERRVGGASPYIFAVHAVHAEEISLTALITWSQSVAEKYAATLSGDPGVLAAGVTRFVAETPGQRSAVALYVAGARQIAPYVSDDRRICANGYGTRT